MRISIGAALLSAILSTSSALAGGWDATTYYVGVSGGAIWQNLERDSDEADSDMGYEIKTKLGARLAPGWGAHLELSYAQVNYDDALGDGDVDRYTAFAMGQYKVPLQMGINPYIEAGAGYGHFSGDNDADGFGLKGGAGIDVSVAPQTSLFLEGHYAHFFDVEDIEVGETTLNVGVSFELK